MADGKTKRQDWFEKILNARSTPATIAGTLALGIVLFLAWDWLKQPPIREGGETNFQIVQALFIGLFALAGFWLTWRRTRALTFQAEAALQQSKTAERGNITERFSCAVEQLGHDELAVRLGGIYALWRIGNDSKEDYPTVLDVLCAFVRAPTQDIHCPGYEPLTPEERERGESPSRFREDVQAVLRLIGGQRTEQQRKLGQQLDFSGANLVGADLCELDFADADFTSANLSRAKLDDANCAGAVFTYAHFVRARLLRTRLMDASLSGTRFSDAVLTGAKLAGAHIDGADFSDACLIEADLTDSDLSNAILVRARFANAVLSGAELTNADFGKAQRLTQQQIDQAFTRKGEEPPMLPEGLSPPPERGSG